jgi:hypothetical protein
MALRPRTQDREAISSPPADQESRTTSRTEHFASHPCAIDAAASKLFGDFINARSAVRRPAYFDVWLTSLSCFTSLSIWRQVCNST